jgi:hypothetical protein
VTGDGSLLLHTPFLDLEKVGEVRPGFDADVEVDGRGALAD